MKFQAFAAAALLALAAAPLHAADHPLQVGGTTIVVPVEDTWLSVDADAPDLRPFAEAGLPPTVRLVGMFQTADNIARIRSGATAEGLFLQVQVVRALEPMNVTDADWQMVLPQITAGMQSLDMNATVADDTGRDQRLTAAAGRDVEMRFGDISQPHIYATDADSVRLLMRVPISVEMAGPQGPQSMQVDVGIAAAFVHVRNKIVQVNWYAVPGNDESVAAARRQLDATVEKMRALNAP